VDAIRTLGQKGTLTGADALAFQEHVRQAGSLRFDLSKPTTPEKIATAAETMSTLSPAVVVAAHTDLLRTKPIYMAISDAAYGTAKNSNTAIDDIMDGKSKLVTPNQFYDNFAATRTVLRAQYGDKIPLFRAVGLQRTKATQNWATTREFAAQFGDNIVQRDIPVSQVVAVNVTKNGKYHEVIVGRGVPAGKAISFGDALRAASTITKLAAPDSLYVHRPLANADRLHAWAKAAGIPNLVPPHEMHVTQVYSRKPVDLEPRSDTVMAVGDHRHLSALGDKGAVVLHFQSPALQARHAEAMAAGATHDWPKYLTHITLSYDTQGKDVRAIEPPSFPLVFGPEVHAGINENWAQEKGLRKMIAKAFAKYDPDQPRDDDGRWSGGDSPGTKAVGPHDARDVKAGWIKASPLKTIEQVYAGAEANKATLDNVGDKIAAATGAQWRSPGVKKLPRVLEKDFHAALAKMAAGREPAGVTDIVRGTFAVDTPEQADKVAKMLAEHFPATDEGYKTTDVGYFDRAVNVQFKNGQIGEVLLAPPELINAKSESGGGGHTLYKQWRSLPDSDPGKDALAQAQIKLYGAARDSLPDQWKRVVHPLAPERAA